jgi:hypothetical protein
MIRMAEGRQFGRWRLRRWVILGCAVITISCWWWLREPRYKGISLGSWLDTYDLILTGHLTQPGFEETRTALRHFGKEGVSYYTARIAYETPAWQLALLSQLDAAQTKQGKLQRKLSEWGHNYIDARNRRAKTAALAFELLGTDAAAAVPKLEQLAMSYDYPARTQRAMAALTYIGPSGYLALSRVAAYGNPGPQAEALFVLKQIEDPAASRIGWREFTNASRPVPVVRYR